MEKFIFSKRNPWRLVRFFNGMLVLLLLASPVLAEDTSTQLRENYESATKGKILAFLPTSIVPLTNQWLYMVKNEGDTLGMKVILRDPNYSVSAMTEAISALIALPPTKRPDVMIVNSMDVSSTARLLKQAEELGIWVVQINMVSNYNSAALVGANFHDVGIEQANDVVKQIGTDKPGKVAIVQGEATSYISVEETKSIMQVFQKYPNIKVVSNLAADWNANKAHDITVTVLQQHPDLDAIIGYWGPMDIGVVEAVKEAGLVGKVKVYSSGEVTPFICDAIRSGLFYKYWNYDGLRQGHDIMTVIKILLQLGKQRGMKPVDVKLADFSYVQVMTKENVDQFNCWNPPMVEIKR